jgi:hypothetical protein
MHDDARRHHQEDLLRLAADTDVLEEAVDVRDPAEHRRAKLLSRLARHRPSRQDDGAPVGEDGLDLLILGTITPQPQVQPDGASVSRNGRGNAERDVAALSREEEVDALPVEAGASSGVSLSSNRFR